MNRKKYLAIEETVCFQFSNLIRKVKNSVKKRFPEVRDDEYHSLVLKALSGYEINGQKFTYMSIPNHLGGVRWYVECPKCNKPSLKLFLPNKNPEREQKYLCKECHNLKNASLLLGGSKRYEKIIRPLRRLEHLKKTLLGPHMTPQKAEELLAEYDTIEKSLGDSPEFKLWMFQRKHGRNL